MAGWPAWTHHGSLNSDEATRTRYSSLHHAIIIAWLNSSTTTTSSASLTERCAHQLCPDIHLVPQQPVCWETQLPLTQPTCVRLTGPRLPNHRKLSPSQHAPASAVQYACNGIDCVLRTDFNMKLGLHRGPARHAWHTYDSGDNHQSTAVAARPGCSSMHATTCWKAGNDQACGLGSMLKCSTSTTVCHPTTEDGPDQTVCSCAEQQATQASCHPATTGSASGKRPACTIGFSSLACPEAGPDCPGSLTELAENTHVHPSPIHAPAPQGMLGSFTRARHPHHTML